MFDTADVSTDSRGVVYNEYVDYADLPKGWAQCGNCLISWDDTVSTSVTPVPSGRCPFEADHEDDCEGHETTSGAIGSTVYCDGTCQPTPTIRHS